MSSIFYDVEIITAALHDAVSRGESSYTCSVRLIDSRARLVHVLVSCMVEYGDNGEVFLLRSFYQRSPRGPQ